MIYFGNTLLIWCIFQTKVWNNGTKIFSSDLRATDVENNMKTFFKNLTTKNPWFPEWNIFVWCRKGIRYTRSQMDPYWTSLASKTTKICLFRPPNFNLRLWSVIKNLYLLKCLIIFKLPDLRASWLSTSTTSTRMAWGHPRPSPVPGRPLHRTWSPMNPSSAPVPWSQNS